MWHILLIPPISDEKGTELIALIMTLPQRVMGLGDYNMATAGVWWFICAYPGITPSGLTHLTSYPSRTVSRVLRRLLDEGWVEQYADEIDGRVRHYKLTDTGKEAWSVLLEDMRSHLARLLAEDGSAIKN